MSKKIVIIGCGRLGSYLANALSRSGHSVMVVDRNDAVFEYLSADYSGFRLEGDATQIGVLREAGIEDADLCFATTRSDNVNLMVSQIAKRIFKVPGVLARVYDPVREAAFAELGIETIGVTTTAAEMFLMESASLSARATGAAGGDRSQ